MNQEEFDFMFELEHPNSCLKVNCDQWKVPSPSDVSPSGFPCKLRKCWTEFIDESFTEMNQEEFDFMFELEYPNFCLKVNCDQTKKIAMEFWGCYQQKDVWNILWCIEILEKYTKGTRRS